MGTKLTDLKVSTHDEQECSEGIFSVPELNINFAVIGRSILTKICNVVKNAAKLYQDVTYLKSRNRHKGTYF